MPAQDASQMAAPTLRGLVWLLACWSLALILGCAPATRYPQVKIAAPVSAKADTPPPLNPNHVWLEPQPTFDAPIEFVAAETQPELWRTLKDFWNPPPPGWAGARTIHLGQNPLGAAAALVAVRPLEVVRVKVPLGLPDPTPYIPTANPPTFRAWQLGKKLFFDPTLLPGPNASSCVSCHKPAQGFSQHKVASSDPMEFNPPSLINCVYNQHQFWDGRARHLEEVLVRSLEEDQPASTPATRDRGPDLRHAWSGIFQRVNRNDGYRREFEAVYGVGQPTLDLIAKALATYLRTILSGNSLIDRAQAQAKQHGRTEPIIEDFTAILDKAALESLYEDGSPAVQTARRIHRGYQLFHGSAHCSQCHAGWNYTDGGFHNVGIRESDQIQEAGREPGRFRALPPGLKDARMIGAFRTPSLRALPRSRHYFHDGKLETLRQVIEYYNNGPEAQFNRYLDARLLVGPGQPRRLGLIDEEIDALRLFLAALDGDPVASAVMSH